MRFAFQISLRFAPFASLTKTEFKSPYAIERPSGDQLAPRANWFPSLRGEPPSTGTVQTEPRADSSFTSALNISNWEASGEMSKIFIPESEGWIADAAGRIARVIAPPKERD